MVGAIVNINRNILKTAEVAVKREALLNSACILLIAYSPTSASKISRVV